MKKLGYSRNFYLNLLENRKIEFEIVKKLG